MIDPLWLVLDQRPIRQAQAIHLTSYQQADLSLRKK
jgi:hypothetical protein